MKLKRKISILVVLCMFVMLFAGTGSIVLADIDSAGLVAHYTFDDNFSDSSGNGNDGSAAGNVSFVQGPLGKAAVFDGKSLVEVKDSDSLDLGGSYTFSVWLFGNDPENWQVILQKMGSVYNNLQAAYTVQLNGMTPQIEVMQSSGNGGSTDARNTIDCHQWYLLTIISDGSSVRFYKNGELFASRDVPDGIAPDKSGGKLTIGQGHTTDDYYYKGRMDDLRIYNRQLSQDEIKQLYSDAAAGAGKDLAAVPKRLVAYYNFNKDVKDYSGYGNDGQMCGGSVTFADSIASKGCYFNGKTYVEVKDSDSLEITGGYTASAWLKLDRLKTEQWAQPILSRTKSSINLTMDSYDFYINSSYTPKYMASFNFNGFASQGWNTSDARDIMSPGVWTMITAVYDGADVKYYRDGKLFGANTLDGDGGDIAHSLGKLQIGHLIDRGNEYFTKGIIDELRVYNYPMTDKEISTLYTCRDSLVVSTPVGVNLAALKAKKNVQLTTKLSTYAYTPSVSVPGTGKDVFKVTSISSKITYKSSAVKVATVSATGKITAVRKGTAIITVSYGQLSANIKVIIK